MQHHFSHVFYFLFFTVLQSCSWDITAGWGGDRDNSAKKCGEWGWDEEQSDGDGGGGDGWGQDLWRGMGMISILVEVSS